MPLPLAIGSLILGGIQAGLGAYNLHKLNKTPQPNFSITPELQKSYGRAEDRTGYGFSPEQRSDYFNGVAGRYNQGLRNASDLSGGQMASAFGRGLQASQLRDFSNFAAQDAAQQQQNIRYADQMGGQMTNQRNMIAQQEIENRRAKEQAFGGALSSGLNNIAGAANFFSMNGGFGNLSNTSVGANGQLTDGYDMQAELKKIHDQSALYRQNMADRNADLALGANGRWGAANRAAMGGDSYIPEQSMNPNLPASGINLAPQMPVFGGMTQGVQNQNFAPGGFGAPVTPTAPGGLGSGFYTGGYDPFDPANTVFNDPGYGGNVTRYNPFGGLNQWGR